MNKTNKLGSNLAGTVFGLRGIFRSSSCSKKNVVVAAIALTTVMLVAGLVFPLKIMANNEDLRTFTVDVAFSSNPGGYVQNNVNPAAPPLDFAPGDTFIQDGSVYPANTIPGGKTTFDANTPGAIGKYRARGTWTTDTANFERAAAHQQASSDMAFASELFLFQGGKSTLLTDGTVPNAYFSADRVVLGGTGSFRYVVGEVHEENIGENIKTGFCNLRVTFILRQVGDGH